MSNCFTRELDGRIFKKMPASETGEKTTEVMKFLNACQSVAQTGRST